ncbi:SDR family NAD(P)-dependent oxidoreductase [Nostoc sp. CHAB 5715]|uniref:SDR family NAD(P)-dependent oxidoreductase n=1 Tax=Nostoc sp. CHAB 5715 TaxID=2780400 RepID=UPI001E4DAAC3|nr:SDR family oxidoreductase [Nostoc sp. CHAB 5715]
MEIDWSGFYAHEKRHRLPLPTYPFERQRYWIEPKSQRQNEHSVSLSKKPDIADWFYIPFWKPSLLPVQIENQELASDESCILVFIDQCGLGSKLVQELEVDNQNIITVKIGENFTVISEHEYTIEPSNNLDYDILIQEICKQNKLPKSIVHLWSVTPSQDKELTVEIVEQAQTTGFYSLLFLAQALGKQETADQLQITVISNNLQPVTGNEEISLEKATLIGPVKVISQEYSNIKCRNIDIIIPESDSWQEAKLVEQLLAELKVSDSEKLVAYRGLNRWVQSFEPVRFEKPEIENPRLREKGVYLITGGLGGIGLVLAEYLAESVQAKLVLVGRSVLPEKDEWEQWLTTHDETDGTSRKIRKVKELESNGAEVLVVSADVSNLEQMQNVIAQAQQQFGQINGVIHAAGVLEGNSIETIENINKANCEQQFKPKVHGIIVLDKVLQDSKLDFCLLFSSLSSILGGLGYVAYSAVNIFMDAFIIKYNQSHPVAWSSISWDSWQLQEEKQQDSSVGASVTEFAFNIIEGIEVFQRILTCNTFNHLVVSTGDIQARVDQWIRLSSFDDNEASQRVNLFVLNSRPDLQNPYVPLTNELERTIANIWQDVLGLKNVGLHDNFFELGGDSLLIIKVRNKILKTLNKNLSIADLFEYSTINSLVEYLDKKSLEKPIFQQADERASRKEAAMQEKRQLMKQRRK